MTSVLNNGVIRALAICVFRNRNRILVAEGYDPVKRQTFYRPLGGRIEFGEGGADAIARELKEELDVKVCDLKFLGALENIFTYAGKRGHEVVLVYDGRFVDESMYDRGEFVGFEDDDENAKFRAVWKSLDECQTARVYPNGLLDLLKNHKG